MQDVPRVFLSYHRADSEADAGRLADTLKRRLGVERVFTDVTDIEFGASWKRVVERTLHGSVALLLVAGPGWTLTEPVAYEVDAALDAGISSFRQSSGGRTGPRSRRRSHRGCSHCATSMRSCSITPPGRSMSSR
jgi:hypothetical protein